MKPKLGPHSEDGWLPNWLCFSLAPDVIIGNDYLWRWWILPRNPLFNIYLHKIMRSDDARALHDHPWRNVSIVLSGTLREVVLVDSALLVARNPDGESFEGEEQTQISRFPGEFVFRHARSPHRIVVTPGQPVWTLFLTGPRYRKWGFHLPGRWMYWKDYISEFGDR